MRSCNSPRIEGLKFAYHETLNASTLIFQSIQKLITGAVSSKELGGVISIVDITAKATESGIAVLILFTALISVNLGILNLLPNSQAFKNWGEHH